MSIPYVYVYMIYDIYMIYIYDIYICIYVLSLLGLSHLPSSHPRSPLILCREFLGDSGSQQMRRAIGHIIDGDLQSKNF